MNERDAEKLLEGLNELARRRHGVQAPARLEHVLVAEFRGRRKLVVLRRWAVGGAIAAAVVIAAGLEWRQRMRPVSSPPAYLAQLPAAPLSLARRAPVKPTRAARKPTAPPVEVATEFFALPGADPFEPIDRGRMVRVRLPRSAMELFGLPVNESRWGEKIQADVVLAEDGMARAVRFVQ